ncbi:hypothetical protein KPN4_113 [Klebsiella phage KPN4]|uniref:Uncharacterized protein n=1 Tax=Klebsiella phage KPN4 TaxID=2601622 RepID=A0A5B9NCA0_9CAUD|nr:hypothetical protein KPN4_113 [Klebsiella phage KPN4]
MTTSNKFSREWSADMARKNRAARYHNKKTQVHELVKGIVAYVEEGQSGVKVDARTLDYSCILWAKQQGFMLGREGNHIHICWEHWKDIPYIVYDQLRGEYIKWQSSTEDRY